MPEPNNYATLFAPKDVTQDVSLALLVKPSKAAKGLFNATVDLIFHNRGALGNMAASYQLFYRYNHEQTAGEWVLETVNLAYKNTQQLGTAIEDLQIIRLAQHYLPEPTQPLHMRIDLGYLVKQPFYHAYRVYDLPATEPPDKRFFVAYGGYASTRDALVAALQEANIRSRRQAQ